MNSVISYLDEQGVHYRVSHHPDTFTSQELATLRSVFAARARGGRPLQPV